MLFLARILFIIAVFYGFCQAYEENIHFRRRTITSWTKQDKPDYSDIRVDEVLNADLLRMENGERVKLIGVEIPESKFTPLFTAYGRQTGKDPKELEQIFNEAVKFVRDTVKGQYVRLDFDAKKSAKKGA